MKIGTLRLLPKGTKVWVISIQRNVIFDEDVIIELDSKICNDNKNFNFKMKILLFNIPGQPYLLDNCNGDLSFINIDDTLPYKLPKPIFFEYTHK